MDEQDARRLRMWEMGAIPGGIKPRHPAMVGYVRSGEDGRHLGIGVTYRASTVELGGVEAEGAAGEFTIRDDGLFPFPIAGTPRHGEYAFIGRQGPRWYSLHAPGPVLRSIFFRASMGCAAPGSTIRATLTPRGYSVVMGVNYPFEFPPTELSGVASGTYQVDYAFETPAPYHDLPPSESVTLAATGSQPTLFPNATLKPGFRCWCGGITYGDATYTDGNGTITLSYYVDPLGFSPDRWIGAIPAGQTPQGEDVRFYLVLGYYSVSTAGEQPRAITNQCVLNIRREVYTNRYSPDPDDWFWVPNDNPDSYYGWHSLYTSRTIQPDGLLVEWRKAANTAWALSGPVVGGYTAPYGFPVGSDVVISWPTPS